MSNTVRISEFDFPPGKVLAGKYEILSRLGQGWEGEVYRIRELETNIERTAKFFYPHRNPGNRALRAYATKLHRLRNCPIVIQYHTQDAITYRRMSLPFLISEFVEGDLLSDFLLAQPGKRLSPFKAVHLLYALSAGMEWIHNQGEYHGDLHTDNVILERFGLGFDLKLVDPFFCNGRQSEKIFYDVIRMIAIFHEALGGQRFYAKQPPAVKKICCGLKHGLIRKKFRNAGQLRQYLEEMNWADQ